MKYPLVILLSICMCVQTFAHSGGTDSRGCHAGSQPYHCHNPKSGNSSSSSTSSSSNSISDSNVAPDLPINTILATIAILGLVISGLAITALIDSNSNLTFKNEIDTRIWPTYDYKSKVVGLNITTKF